MRIPNVKELQKGNIPAQAALIKEGIKPTISFEKYSDSLCQIQELQRGAMKKFLIKLKEVGNLDDISSLRSVLRHEKIRRDGDYLKLYQGIDDETWIYEENLGGTQRLFYFTLSNTFYVVAATVKHFEVGKKR